MIVFYLFRFKIYFRFKHFKTYYKLHDSKRNVPEGILSLSQQLHWNFVFHGNHVTILFNKKIEKEICISETNLQNENVSINFTGFMFEKMDDL